MTTVIKIGDKVTWNNDRIRKEKPTVLPLSISGCKVVELFDVDGEGAAKIDCGKGWEHINCFVADLELEDKPDTTTILSGG